MPADIPGLEDAIKPRSLKRLGEILVERGLLTKVSVDRMVLFAESKKMRLGSLLENVGLIKPEELADALATQYRCRQVRDFAKYSYPPNLLRMIPIEAAVEYSIFPLKLEEKRLGLAVIDPTAVRLFQEISSRHGVTVVPYVTTRTDINRAVARHYMGRNIVESPERSILLVEDDELIATSVKAILTRHGYSVETAPDGMEAFKKIFTHQPTLVITDKIMPKLGGYEFLDAVRKIPEFRFTPVILMTANATPDEEKLALEKGFFDIILKPVKEIGLMTRVRRALLSAESLYGKSA
jgi:CheY-like chemotaxis protein